ncbi:MAG: S41 family peptidase [Oscillospiraceae bacterium]|nr:S41 family peptidase [Oscillospiraceae bacterium]
MKKINLGTAMVLMACTAGATFVITLSISRTQFQRQYADIEAISDRYQRLEELDSKVRDTFYKEIPQEDVTDGILMGYMAGLGDKYSTYRSEKDLLTYEDNNVGVYTGIGISVQPNESGYVVIVDVTEGGSAEKAGIKVNDILVEVEGISAKESYQEAISQISGEAGTYVNLRIRKNDSGKEEKLSLMRVQLNEKTIHSQMLENHIGYIRITKFRSVTAEQFESARKNLLKEGAEGFIFDVRDNGGGVVSALEQMTDPLLPEGELAFAVSRDGSKQPLVVSDEKYMDMPYVVLMNGNSASSSELFACLLRDFANAKLVGEKSYGKGIMQTTFSLSSGGVTLTTATIETAVTPCYHGEGLMPDVESVLTENAETDTQLEDAVKTIQEMINTQS